MIPYPGPTTHLLDIGASVISYGDIKREEPQGKTYTPHTLDAAITTLVQLAGSWHTSDDVIVAVPGLVTRHGYIENALYSPLKRINLLDLLRQSSDCKRIRVFNDAKLQAHAFLDPGRCHFHITVGTAVGGAFVNETSVFGGNSNFAGEIGHVSVANSNLVCPCGRVGCVDTLASGWSLERDLGKRWWRSPSTVSSSRVALAGAAIAAGLLNAANLLDISSFSIAGRLSRSAPFIETVCALTADRLNHIPAESTSWLAALQGARKLPLISNQ